MDFAALAHALTSPGAASTGMVVGIVFVIVGLAFKISAAPFHMWTPDVYEGSPAAVTVFLATAPKIAAMALFLRIMAGPFGHLLASWQLVIEIVSVASMVLGAFAAIGQTNIKRLMAYSSIGHMGYALIGLAVGNQLGLRGVLVYLIVYIFMSAGTWACIIAMRRQGHAVEKIEDLAGLARTDPGLALAFAVFMFSMAGIPPLAGFFGKLYVFLAAVQSGMWTIAHHRRAHQRGGLLLLSAHRQGDVFRRAGRGDRPAGEHDRLRRRRHRAVHLVLLPVRRPLRRRRGRGGRGIVRLEGARFPLPPPAAIMGRNETGPEAPSVTPRDAARRPGTAFVSLA